MADEEDPWADIRKKPKSEYRSRINKPGRASFGEGNARRDQFIEMLRNDRTIQEACDELGIQRSTYARWRERWSDFRHKVDMVRAERGHTVSGTKAIHFADFRRKYLNYITYPHQQLMVEAIEKSPAQSITMILVPPEHGKTTLVEDWITFKLATEPNTRITIVSEGQPHARKILRRVQARLSDNMSKMWADYGPFYENGQERRGKPWSSDFFTVFKATHDERDYSLECRGWRSAVAGTRTDYLIIDDVTSMKNHGQAVDIVATLRQDFFTRPGKEGHTIIVGTRVASGDVYEKLLEATDHEGKPIITSTVIKPAISTYDGSALCPEMWDLEQLKRKRAIVGEAVWWRNYQQKPRAAGDLTFSEEVIERANNEFLSLRTPLADGHTIMGLDPALGGGNSFVALSYNDTMTRLMDWRREWGLARTEDILAIVDEQCRIFAQMGAPVEDLVIEFNNFQRGLGRDDRMIELSHRHGFRIIPHTTGGGGNTKLDEVLGIGALATDMSKGTFELPYALDCRDKMATYTAECMAWQPRKSGKELRQDLVVATWFPWIVISNRRKVLQTMAGTEGWKRQAMPFAPTSYAKIGSYN